MQIHLHILTAKHHHHCIHCWTSTCLELLLICDYSRWCIKRVGGCSAIETRVFGMLVQGFESGSGAAVSTGHDKDSSARTDAVNIWAWKKNYCRVWPEGSHQKVGWRVFSCGVSPSASIRKVVEVTRGSCQVLLKKSWQKKGLRTCTERWNKMSENFLAGCGWNSWLEAWSWGNRELHHAGRKDFGAAIWKCKQRITVAASSSWIMSCKEMSGNKRDEI